MGEVLGNSNKKLFKCVSLFAGGGGSSTGYRLAGGDVLAINEFVPAAQETYAANYPNTYIFKEDIRKLSGGNILQKIGVNKGELDILDGSPPCSSFSIAGKKEEMWGQVKKYSDTEQQTDDLFFEFARILKDIQPKVFVCENVAGITSGAAASLLGSDQFSLFGGEENTIYHTLVNCGYKVRYKVLNSKDYGVPQGRERCIFIGVRNDINNEISFPVGNNNFVSVGEALNTELIFENNKSFYTYFEPIKYIKGDGNCFNATKVKFNHTIPYLVKRHGVNVSQKDRKDLSKILIDAYSNVSPTVLSAYKGLGNGIVECEDETGVYLRKLSIPELKVICSFPMDYKLLGNYSKQWERLGRAVPPLMMKAIAEHIYNTILKQQT